MNALLISFVVIATLTTIKGTSFCAKFPGPDQLIMGYFQMKVNHGVGSYSFSLDMSEFADATTCDLSNGLYYHLHTSWNDDEKVSGLGSDDCSSTITGGHYDPNLACSASSQDAAGKCVALERTSDLGYSYNCSSSVYNAGIYAQCEVGDLSGKFGIVYPSPNYRFVQPFSAHTDYQPPYVSNYLKNDAVAQMFSSIVFHCVDSSKTRLVCAKLEEIDDDDICGHSDASFTGSLKVPPQKTSTAVRVVATGATTTAADEQVEAQPAVVQPPPVVGKAQSAAGKVMKSGGKDAAGMPTKSPSAGLHKPTWKPSSKPAEQATGTSDEGKTEEEIWGTGDAAANKIKESGVKGKKTALAQGGEGRSARQLRMESDSDSRRSRIASSSL